MFPADASEWKRLFPTDRDAQADSDPRDSSDANDGPAGVELGHFVIEGLIGRGGMGAVFRAIDKRLQRIVALKVLTPDLSRETAAVQRFRNEAQASARLDHDNIARVHYIGEDRGLHFIAYEFVTGSNIRDLIQETGRLHPAEAINYTLQIAAALKHTSAAGVVHRDIKPSNIVVTPAGRAKLVDLGLARKENSESVGELTVAGTTLGTFDYISPEQAKDPRDVDVRSDIYSLGCTLYQMLTGEPPYPQVTIAQKLLHHQGNEPPDASKKNRHVPAELSVVVQKMMASDPRRRHKDPDELIRDLMLVAGKLGIGLVNPEGLVWSSAMNAARTRFWQRNLGWMATAGALLLIVFALEQYPGLIPQPNVSSSDEPPNSASPDIVKRDRKVDQNVTTEPRGIPKSNFGNNDDENKTAGVVVPPAPTAPAQIETSNSNGTKSLDRKEVLPTSETGQPRKTTGSTAVNVVENPPPKDERATSVGSSSVAAPVPVTADTSAAATVATSGNSETLDPKSAPMNVDEPPPITIVGEGDAAGKSFNTLEAACAAAKDGNVIVLRYNGPRPELEKPFRIANKTITIRGEESFRPSIVFQTSSDPGLAAQSRMLTLIGASVRLVNVDLHMKIPKDADLEQSWAIFNLQGSEQIELKEVTITLRNSETNPPAAVFELTSGPEQNLVDIKMMKDGQGTVPEEFGIKISESFVRGGCDFFKVEHTRPGRFEIENSVLAIDGTLLSVLGDLDMPAEKSDLELQLEHVTCLVGNSLIRWDSGPDPHDLLPVQVTSRNNILSTKTEQPLIAMTGNTDIQDFNPLLRWNGEKNFYDRFPMFWSTTDFATNQLISLDFDEWKSLWGAATEVDAHGENIGWRIAWWNKPFSDLVAADLVLDRNIFKNAAAGGAADGSDAGADLDRLPATPTRVLQK